MTRPNTDAAWAAEHGITRGSEMTKGPAFLLKFSDGETPPSYTTVAGLRATSLNIEQPHSASIEASGIFLSPAAEIEARNHALTGSTPECELSFEDGSKMRGRFLIMRLDYAGDFNGERNYTMRLESAGDVVPA